MKMLTYLGIGASVRAKASNRLLEKKSPEVFTDELNHL